MSLIAALPLDVLRKSFGLLDLPDLCSSSAVAVVPQQVARPLFFELLKREFPHAAAEEKRVCGGVAGTSVDDRERALELAARRRLTHERRIRALADAIDVAGEVVHESLPPLPPIDVDDLSIFLRLRHGDRIIWQGEPEGTCAISNGSLEYNMNLTPEVVDYPELWTMARSPPDNSTEYSTAATALFHHLLVTVLLLRKSDSKIAQLVGARAEHDCVGSQDDPDQCFLFDASPLRDSSGSPLGFDCRMMMDIFFDKDAPEITQVSMYMDPDDGDSDFVDNDSKLSDLLTKMKWE